MTKLVIPVKNIPLGDVNNFCVNYGAELYLDHNEPYIVLLEVVKK